MVRFPVFREYMRSLEGRNKRLELRRLSLRADLLEERSKSSGLEFRYLMQGDFLLFMRAEMEDEDGYSSWRPETSAFIFLGFIPLSRYLQDLYLQNILKKLSAFWLSTKRRPCRLAIKL